MSKSSTRICVSCGVEHPLTSIHFGKVGKGFRRVCITCKPVASATRASSERNKACGRCGVAKPATTEFFYPVKTSKDGLCGRCRSCTNEQARVRHAPKIKPRPLVVNEVGQVRCSKCKTHKPKPDFANAPDRHTGVRAWCRACEAQRYQERRIPAESRALPQQGLRRCSACEKIYPATREYFGSAGGPKASHTGLVSMCRGCRCERYRPLAKAAAARRRARKHNTPMSEWVTKDDVVRQMTSQQGRCYWCSKPLEGTYHLDHLIPLSRGGSNRASNIVCACPKCNQSKNDKMPHEWNGRLL